MIAKELQDKIIKHLTEFLKDKDVGLLIVRAGDGALVVYVNDKQSAVRDAMRFQNKEGQGGN